VTFVAEEKERIAPAGVPSDLQLNYIGNNRDIQFRQRRR
jgi:hypothetical protein